MLVEIAATEAPDRLRPLLREYVDARSVRLAESPDLAAIERRYERREGTAEYVGCLAATRATSGTADELSACLLAELKEEYAEIDDLIRWRLYSSGAVMSAALDRLGVEGWRDSVASGGRLDQIVAREVE